MLRADCFIPYIKREIGKPTKLAHISGCKNAENLRNGIDRNNYTYGDTDNGTFTSLNNKLTYTFDSPQYVEIAHIVFDSDLDRITLPGGECERYHSMRSNLLPDSPKMHMPKTLVKDYTVECVLEDGSIKNMDFTDNIGRMNEIVIDSLVKSVSLIPKKLWCDEEKVHIFSFDLY